ncbi:hypothetical protein E2C01_005636 [Portunus trituberculatus]|uniref:Uncharacterized protein n=1 Tax=Portunus trituberculatus TaxID=210409 RepID=A0A5B7CVL0_PORTR|nr:hypothetical protein [Portunus trituberculatus]
MIHKHGWNGFRGQLCAGNDERGDFTSTITIRNVDEFAPPAEPHFGVLLRLWGARAPRCCAAATCNQARGCGLPQDALVEYLEDSVVLQASPAAAVWWPLYSSGN